MDSGSRYDIHPKEKRNVGIRLARAALAELFRQPVKWRAPRIAAVEKEDGRLLVRFDYAEGGLANEGGLSQLFTLRAGDWEIPVAAELSGDTVLLFSEQIHAEEIYELSFAYRPYVEVRLYNSERICARPTAPRRV